MTEKKREAIQKRMEILLLYRCFSHLVFLGITLTVSIRNPVLYPPELRGRSGQASIMERHGVLKSHVCTLWEGYPTIFLVGLASPLKGAAIAHDRNPTRDHRQRRVQGRRGREAEREEKFFTVLTLS
jgi:hypothetical protein